MKEADIQLQCVQTLKLDGWLCLRNAQHGFSFKGMADYTVCKDGRVVWIEFKSKSGNPSEHQIEFARMLQSVKCEYRVARSLADIEDLLENVKL